MHRGYVKIHRKSVDNPLYKKPLIWHFWMYCLIRANHEENILPFNNKPITIKKGSFIMSLNHAVDDTGLSKQNIRTAIKALVNFKMIEKTTQELTQQATMINICNYSIYQKKKKEANTVSNTSPTQSQHSANTQPTLDNEPLNTIKNVKNKTPSVTSDYSEAFERWWLIFPKRDGKVRGKKKTYPMFKRINKTEYSDLGKATINYSKEKFIRDPERFLKDDYWRDFIEDHAPPEKQKPQTGKMTTRQIMQQEMLRRAEQNQSQPKDITPNQRLLNG